MIIMRTPYVVIEWDEDVKCVTAEWRAYVDGADYREAQDKTLEVLLERKGVKLLADTRAMKTQTQEDQEWIATSWLPRAKAVGLKYFAVILPKSAVAQIAIHQMAKKAGPRPTGPESEVAYFDNIADALQWLRSLPNK